AVKQARSQAAAMAAAAGLRITGVVSIQEDQNDRYAVYGVSSEDVLAPSRSVAVPIRTGRSQVSASVTAVFADAPA
ncbi:MAG TPA: SIMPL domain-containing protein, partial [Gaiellales bacterium]|nr:SIMPL domain-containing protein [Gaiellales bacterium]